jgi:hypothetical protein
MAVSHGNMLVVIDFHPPCLKPRASCRCDMKIPSTTILDFHAHGCPIGHEGLLFPLRVQGLRGEAGTLIVRFFGKLNKCS